MRRLRGHAGVEGPDQPVERRVVDQVVHHVVQGVLHPAQMHPASAQHAVRQLPQGGGCTEADVHLGGGAAQGQRLLLDVEGETLQAGHQAQAGGLELLGEGEGQRQGAGLDRLRGGGTDLHHLTHFTFKKQGRCKVVIVLNRIYFS